MVAGHLQEKGEYYYIVLSYRDINKKRKTKWISTGLKLKGNKKKAEELLLEVRKNFKPEFVEMESDMLFADFLEQWLEIVKTKLRKALRDLNYSYAHIEIVLYDELLDNLEKFLNQMSVETNI